MGSPHVHSHILSPLDHIFGPLLLLILFPISSARDWRLDSFTLHMPGMGLCREKGREVSRISLAPSGAGFFTLSTVDIWGQITMCVGKGGRDGCLVHCSLLAVSLALYALDTGSIPHPLSCDKLKCLLALSNVPWWVGKLPPAETHYSRSSSSSSSSSRGRYFRGLWNLPLQ